MPGLISIDDIPSFREVRNVVAKDVTDELRASVKGLHESEDIEELLAQS
jgi:hypothetical protein